MVPVNVLMRAVAQRLEIPYADLVARPELAADGPRVGRRSGDRRHIRARQVVQFVAHRKGSINLSEIGRRLGYDHSTIRYNVLVIDNFLRRRDPMVIDLYRTIIRVWVRLKQSEFERRVHSKTYMRSLPLRKQIRLGFPTVLDPLDKDPDAQIFRVGRARGNHAR